MNKTEQYIYNIAKNAPIGHNISIKCPACMDRKGTDDIASKLYFVRELGMIKYHCFAASCGISGYIPENSSIGKAGSGRHFVPKKYAKPLQMLSKDNEILTRYNITIEQANFQGWKHAFVDNFLYVPVLNAYGAHIADYLKRLGDKDDRPKNLLYKHEDYPLIHFPRDRGIKPVIPKTLVLVEDPISALKVGNIQTSAALLGTYLSSEMVFLLRGFKLDRAVLFLDSDATGTALKYRNKYNHLLPFVVLPSPKGYDPKDLSMTDLNSTFKALAEQINKK